MAKTQEALGLYPAVGNDAHNAGHKERDDTLHGIEPSDDIAVSVRGEEGTHAGKVGTPDGEFQEIHQRQA